MKKIEGGITAAKGFQAAGGAAGIKKQGVKDMQNICFISNPSYGGFYFDHLTLRRSTVPKTKSSIFRFRND